MDTTLTKQTLLNYASNKIGGNRFTIGDGSEADKVFATLWTVCLETLLEECPWSFATKTVALVVNSVVVIPDFGDGVDIAYNLPTDYLKLYMVNYPNALLRFENIGGSYYLLSNTSGLMVKYTFKNEVVSTYSSKFYEALACKLAKEACFKISEASQHTSKMSVEYEKAFVSAAAADGQMSSPDQSFQDEWIFARLAGSNTVISSPNGNIGMFPTGVQDF